jgi:hypothetical protein
MTVKEMTMTMTISHLSKFAIEICLLLEYRLTLVSLFSLGRA